MRSLPGTSSRRAHGSGNRLGRIRGSDTLHEIAKAGGPLGAARRGVAILPGRDLGPSCGRRLLYVTRMPIHDTFSNRNRPRPSRLTYDALPDALRRHCLRILTEGVGTYDCGPRRMTEGESEAPTTCKG